MSTFKLLAWDIENAPAQGYHWGLWQQNVSLSQLIKPSSTISFAARWYGDPKNKIMFHSDFHDGHDVMLKRAWELLDEADALLSWNGKGFDTKHIYKEFILAGMVPPSPIKEIDLMIAVKNRFKFMSNKLDFVAQQLGVGSKVKHEGFDLWIKCMEGDAKAWERMKKYNKQDVHLLIDLYNKLLPWIPNHPNMNLYDGKGCPACGKGNLQHRGFSRTLVGVYQRYQCMSCGGWSKSGKSIETVEIRGDK